MIALQTRGGEEELVAAVDDGETHLCLRAEREFLRLLEGDCDLPVGVHARLKNKSLELRAQLFGEATAPKMESGRGSDPIELARAVFRRIEHTDPPAASYRLTSEHEHK